MIRYLLLCWRMILHYINEILMTQHKYITVRPGFVWVLPCCFVYHVHQTKVIPFLQHFDNTIIIWNYFNLQIFMYQNTKFIICFRLTLPRYMKNNPCPMSPVCTIYSLGRYNHGFIFSVKCRRKAFETEEKIGTYSALKLYEIPQ